MNTKKRVNSTEVTINDLLDFSRGIYQLPEGQRSWEGRAMCPIYQTECAV